MSNIPLRAIGGRPRLASSRVRLRLPMLKEAFFGFSLRTGCLVIGWLGVICTVLAGFPLLLFGGDVLAGSKPSSHEVTANESLIVQICGSMVICIAFLLCLSAFIFTLLLFGIYKEKQFCMVPLMLIQIMGIFGSMFTIPFGALIIWETSLPWMLSYYISLYIISSVLFNVAVEFYFFLVVFSFFRLVGQKGQGIISNVDSQYPLNYIKS